MAKNDAADLKKELARDFIALGGIPFYLLVVARLTLPPIDWTYMLQFVFAAIVFTLFTIAFRFKIEVHAGLGIILLVLISLYYKNMFFTIFAVLVYIILVSSLFYLKAGKARIWKGILIGLVSIAVGYFAANLVF